jgi:hypothetical protein
MSSRSAWLAVTIYSLLPVTTIFAADLLVQGVSNTNSQKTRLTLSNRAAFDTQATLSFVGQPDAPPVEPVTRTLPPLTTLVLGDVLSELWGLSEQQGTVLITTDQPTIVSAVKYIETDSGGRAGSPLPVSYSEDLLTPSSFGDLLWIQQTADAPGSSAILSVYVAKPDTQVDIRLFDSEGTQIAANSIQSGPATLLIPIASMVEGPLSLARAQLKVISGSATAALEVVDNQTGYRTTASVLQAGMDGKAFVLASAYHLTSRQNAQLQTGIRLFNPASAAARITFSYQSATKTLDLPPKGLLEINDILGDLFEAELGAQGRVDLQSTQSIFASLRTLSMPQPADETAASTAYAELRPAAGVQPLITTGETAVIAGLRGSGAQLLLNLRASASADAQADLILRDTDGQSIAGATLNLEKSTTTSQNLADLFPGVSIPDDAILEIQALTGDLDPSLLIIDSTTADADILAAQVSTAEPACARPEISFVNTSSRNLVAPGEVTFSWATKLADNVSLSPGAESFPASSSFTAKVAATTTFRLLATNSCGETVASLPVSVGSPKLTSISVEGATGSAAEGQPGQLFAITLDNVGDVSGLSGLILREGTRSEQLIPLAGFTDDGVPFARIPYLADSAVSSGYRSGSFTLTAVVEGKETATIPFTIQPLPVVADPVAEFRLLLDRLAAAGRDELAQLPDASEAVLASLAISTRMEADLRKMLSDIEATGKGVLALGQPAKTTTPAPSVTVTRNDLAALLALNANYLASVPADPAPDPQPKSAAQAPRNLGTCIKDKQPYIPLCKAIEDTVSSLWILTDPAPQVFNNQELDQAFQKGRDAAVDYMKRRLQESALNGVAAKLNLMLNWTNILCAIQPIRLKRFDLVPKFFPITRDGYPIAAELRAVLVPKFKDKDIANVIIDQETKKIMDQIPQKYKDEKQLIEPVVKTFVQSLYGDLNNELAALIQKYIPGVKNEATYQVGKCDIARFYAKRNGPEETKFDPATVIIKPVDTGNPNWGRDAYKLQGVRKGPETMCIRPFAGSFLPSAEVLAKGLFPPQSNSNMCQFQTGPITTGRQAASPPSEPRFDLRPERVLVHFTEVNADGQASLAVTSSDLNSWCWCLDQNPTGNVSPGKLFSGDLPIADGTYYSDTFSWRNSGTTAKVSASKLSDETWLLFLKMNRVVNERGTFGDSLARIKVRFNNPPNRENSQTIGLDISVDPGCISPIAISGFVSGPTGGSINIVQAPKYPFAPLKQSYPGATTGTLMITVGGDFSGFPNGVSSCAVAAKVQLFDAAKPANP